MNTKPKSPFTQVIFCLPALVTAGAIFYVSSLEQIELPLGGISFNDLLFHFAAYFFFGLTLFAAAHPWHDRTSYPLRTYALLISIGIVYALSDEIHQSFVPHRSCTAADFAADSMGVILAQVSGWIWIRRKDLR